MGASLASVQMPFALHHLASSHLHQLQQALKHLPSRSVRQSDPADGSGPSNMSYRDDDYDRGRGGYYDDRGPPRGREGGDGPRDPPTVSMRLYVTRRACVGGLHRRRDSAAKLPQPRMSQRRCSRLPLTWPPSLGLSQLLSLPWPPCRAAPCLSAT